jgi:hypothetical protein
MALSTRVRPASGDNGPAFSSRAMTETARFHPALPAASHDRLFAR